jgi:TetR/AcrR family transcriptional regulator, transcriptional repressor for nem operon
LNGLKVWLGRVQRSNSQKSKESYSDRYLSRWHRDNPGQGCTAAALAQELARSTPELKAAFEQGLENILSASGDRKEAIFQVAAMIGGVVLARAVQDHRLSDEILKSVRQKLRSA